MCSWQNVISKIAFGACHVLLTKKGIYFCSPSCWQKSSMPVAQTSCEIGWVNSHCAFVLHQRLFVILQQITLNDQLGQNWCNYFCQNNTCTSPQCCRSTWTWYLPMLYLRGMYKPFHMSCNPYLAGQLRACQYSNHERFSQGLPSIENWGPYFVQKNIKGECWCLSKKSTVWLTDDKQKVLFKTLFGWLHSANNSVWSFLLVMVNRHHLPYGPRWTRFQTPSNVVMCVALPTVFFHCNTSSMGLHLFNLEAMSHPIQRSSCMAKGPKKFWVQDFSSFCIGGVVLWENMALQPIYLCLQWPPDIRANIESSLIPFATQISSAWVLSFCDLWSRALLALRMPINYKVCIALLSSNPSAVHWMQHLTSKASWVHSQFGPSSWECIYTRKGPSVPSTSRQCQFKTDIPSQSLGSAHQWHCKDDVNFLALIVSPIAGLWESLLVILKNQYVCDFHSADEGFYNGWVVATFFIQDMY